MSGGVPALVPGVLGALATAIPVALGVLVVVVVLAWAVRRWRRTPGDRFASVLAARDQVSVLTHPNPDPDAMASALAVAHLAESVGTDAVIQYPGTIRHQENQAFRSVLDLDLERIEDRGELRESVVLVDHNQPRGFIGAGGVTPFAVMDHHPGGGEGMEFTDVRTDYGACSTVLAEYLRDRGLRPDAAGEVELPERLATGLLFGILSDTTNLTRGCSMHEFDACAYLYDAADPEILDRVANPEVDAEVLDIRSRAISNRTVQGPFLVSDVGEVDNVDAIAQAADELLRLSGVSVAVVFGASNGTLHVSGRSRDDDVHVGNILQSVVDDIPMADAGGHARMGGGQVSLAHMEGLGPSDGLSRDQFRTRLFTEMGSAA